MTYLTLDNQLQKWFHLLWERKRGRKDHLLFYKPKTREHAKLQVLLAPSGALIAIPTYY